MFTSRVFVWVLVYQGWADLALVGPKIENGQIKSEGKDTHRTRGYRLEQKSAAVNTVLSPEICTGP